MRILLLRTDHLGDSILTIPLALSLHRQGHEVCVASWEKWREVWSNQPIKEFLPLPEERYPSLKTSWRWAELLRRHRFDAICVFEKKLSLLMTGVLSGARLRFCMSGGFWGRILFNRPLRSGLLKKPRHYLDVCLDFARTLGVPEDKLVRKPDLALSPEERVDGEKIWRSLFPCDKARVIVHPFHGKSTCHPPLERYLELTERLAKAGNHVLLTGLPHELETIRARGIAENEEVRFLPSGTSLRSLFAIVATARLVICGSTGMLHVASAVDTPSVSIFCSHPHVGPEIWGPLSSKNLVLKAPQTHCFQYRKTCSSNCSMISGPEFATVFKACQELLES